MRISVRFVLSIGVTLFVITAVGLVGGLSTWGAVKSTLEITRTLQQQETARVAIKIKHFVNQVEEDVITLSEILGQSAENLENLSVIWTFKPFVKNKSYLNSLTLVRKDRSNVSVWREDGEEPVAEVDGELDEESIYIAVRGKPGDGTEGFDDMYMEPIDKLPVISYTKHLSDCCGTAIGTIYLDLDLTTLSAELTSSTISAEQRLFVFDKRGAAIAHPSLADIDAYQKWSRLPRISELGDPVATAVQAEVARNFWSPDFVLNEITVADKVWLTSIARIHGVGDHAWYAVSVVPREVVLGPAISRTILISVIGLITLVIAIFIALAVGRSIVSPIDRLATAADAVQTLNIDIPSERHSRFSELDSAERAFNAMLHGLEVFIRYVPKNLVKRLIQLEAKGRGVEAEEREVTILFTDIAGYTSISDGMDPKDLAGLLNDYFEVLVGPVTARGGTVDKFIGDALMAFWNAPDEQEDHADLALGAALEIQRVTQEFNDARVAAGQKPLVTRIGVHTGRVLVGNIGASERMNYTIVGDAVNTTARLEALGKEIGQILCISSDTRDVAKMQYPWREVHRVTLRGRSQETLVYTIPQES